LPAWLSHRGDHARCGHLWIFQNVLQWFMSFGHRGEKHAANPRTKDTVAYCSLHKMNQNSLTKMVSPLAGKLESEFEEGNQPDA